MTDINTKLEVRDIKGKVVEHIQLPEDIFNGEVNGSLLYEANKMYEARKRKGAASSKTRGEVRGGGAKPWRQKGTGRARVGSSRNPIWRHGGVAFGPKPRDFGYSMPKKALRKALLSSLNARLRENMIKPVVKIELKKAKTKEFKRILKDLQVSGKALVLVNEMSEDVRRSASNLRRITMKEGRNVNARDVLLNEQVVVEKAALEKIIERLK